MGGKDGFSHASSASADSAVAALSAALPDARGEQLSSIPPPYEMAFPPPRPKKKTHPLAVTMAFAFAAVLGLAALGATGYFGWSHWSDVRARERQLETMRSERILDTRVLLGQVHDSFPLDITDERACDDAHIPDGTRTPLLSFAELGEREGTGPSPAEAMLQPTSFKVTRETVLDGPVVAVLMTSSATIVPGNYDGWIVVFDRKATPLCQAHVVAKGGTSFVELQNQLRGAERAAAGRLSPNLALEL